VAVTAVAVAAVAAVAAMAGSAFITRASSLSTMTPFKFILLIIVIYSMDTPWKYGNMEMEIWN
jgi:hypothetical protein